MRQDDVPHPTATSNPAHPLIADYLVKHVSWPYYNYPDNVTPDDATKIFEHESLIYGKEIIAYYKSIIDAEHERIILDNDHDYVIPWSWLTTCTDEQLRWVCDTLISNGMCVDGRESQGFHIGPLSDDEWRLCKLTRVQLGFA